MNEKIISFEDLDVWKRSRELKNKYIKLAISFPKDERFRLTDQLIRAARFITNNIAEGYGRFHYKENIQFCRVSRGSMYDVWIIFIAVWMKILLTKNYLKSLKWKRLDVFNY